jgi:hypothetical protein
MTARRQQNRSTQHKEHQSVQRTIKKQTKPSHNKYSSISTQFTKRDKNGKIFLYGHTKGAKKRHQENS